MSKEKQCSKGEVTYDEEYDILYVRLNDLDYSRSIEMENIIVDFDNKKCLTGFRILDASEFFKVPKQTLTKARKWTFNIVLEENKLELRIEFEVKQKNKTYIKSPIIIESLHEKVPNAELVCAVG